MTDSFATPQWTTAQAEKFEQAQRILGALIAAGSARLARAHEPDQGEVEELNRFIQEQRELSVRDQARCEEIIRDYPGLLRQLRARELR